MMKCSEFSLYDSNALLLLCFNLLEVVRVSEKQLKVVTSQLGNEVS